MARKNISRLDQAAKRLAEIFIEQMSSLPLEKAKAIREEIRRLAGKPSRRAGRGETSPPRRNAGLRSLSKTSAKFS
jgi:hypothetical protein